MDGAVRSALEEEIRAFPGQAAVLLARMPGEEILFAHRAEERVVSASTVKVAILCAVLEACDKGELSPQALIAIPEEDICPDTRVFEPGNRRPGYPLWELLYWMTALSDNTATNAVIGLVGCEAVNRWCAAHGLRDTLLQRKMLDWDAIAAGRNNYTSPADQCRLYGLLCRGEILTPSSREMALDFLGRQRHQDSLLRYLPDPVAVAHKGGCLDYLEHDAGVFFLEGNPYFLGVFTWDGPSPEGDPRQRQFIGRLSRAVYCAMCQEVAP